MPPPPAASAPSASGTTIFLPSVVGGPGATACSPPAEPTDTDSGAAECAAPAEGGWIVRCGGMGRIRDLWSLSGDRMLAVGDGIAEVGRDRSGQWAVRAQLGRDMTGLNAAYVNPGAGCEACGWAVGERDRITRIQGGCGLPYDDHPATNTRIVLTSIFTADDPVRGRAGWIVGRDGDRGVVMSLRDEGEGSMWRRASGLDVTGRPMPPLTDVQAVPGPVLGWITTVLGQEDGEGVFARNESVDGREAWRITERVEGFPREIALSSAESGWAFGDLDPEGLIAQLWERVPEVGAWIRHGRPIPGTLLDAYLGSESGSWFGLVAPEPDEPALYSLTSDPDFPRWVGRLAGPPEGPRASGAIGDGNRAIAPLDGGGDVAYAAGDDLWVADIDAAEWSLVARRMRLVDVAPRGGGGWVLEHRQSPPGTGGGDGVGIGIVESRLLQLDAARGGALLVPDGGGIIGEKLNALTTVGNETWAVGERGALWVARGPRQAWRRAAAPGGTDGDLLAVAAEEHARDGAVTPPIVWSVGVGADGHGRLYRWEPDVASGASTGGADTGTWHTVLRTSVPGGLFALTAPPDTGAETRSSRAGGARVVAVGGRTIVAVVAEADCAPGDDSSPIASVTVRRTAGVCVAELTFDPAWSPRIGDLVAVDAAHTQGVWALTDSLVMRSAYGAEPWDPAPAAWEYYLAPGMPFGGRLSSVAAADSESAWVAYTCCQGAHDPGREATHVRLARHTGRGFPLEDAGGTVFNVPLSRLRLERRGADEASIWAVGDWSTLASLPVGPAP